MGNGRFHGVRNTDTAKANQARTSAADAHARDVAQQLKADLRYLEFKRRLRQMADSSATAMKAKEMQACLSKMGITSRRGEAYSPVTVQRLRDRILRLEGWDIMAFETE